MSGRMGVMVGYMDCLSLKGREETNPVEVDMDVDVDMDVGVDVCVCVCVCMYVWQSEVRE